MSQPKFKQWDHLEPADKARRIAIVSERLKNEKAAGTLPYEGMNAHAIFCVAARLDGDLKLAQEYLDVAVPYSQANTRYATWVKFRRLEKPFDALLALAQKSNLLDDAKQLLANDLGLTEEQQLRLIQETNPQLVGDVGANPAATPKVMEAVSDFKNVISRARLAENPGLSIALMEKLLADKRQAQVGLAKNWMITDEIRQKLFETLDPEVIYTLALRDDQDKSAVLPFALRSIEKYESSSSFDMQRQTDSLKLWIMEQPDTPMEIWLPFLKSSDSEVFSAAISKLPIDYPGLEALLEANLDRYLSTNAVLKHPGFTDALVDKVFNSDTTRFRLKPLQNPHLSERSVTKLVEYGEELIAKDFKNSITQIRNGWLPEDAGYVIHLMHNYLHAGGKHLRDRIQASISKIESEANKSFDPNAPRDYGYFNNSSTDAEDSVKRHRDLGYQYPDVPAEWLLKNVKNRNDEIKKDVLLNPSLPVEAMKIFALDKKPEIRKALSLLPNCPDDIKALVALQ